MEEKSCKIHPAFLLSFARGYFFIGPVFPLTPFRHGSAERVYRLEFVSNQDFTDTEFQKWVETMSCNDLELPTVPEWEKKLSDIRSTYQYRFNENDIEQVIQSSVCTSLLPWSVRVFPTGYMWGWEF